MNTISMKVKKDRIELPSSLHTLINRNDDISEEILIKNQKKIKAYLLTVCRHLENLKQEIYNTIDAGNLNLRELFSPLNNVIPIEGAGAQPLVENAIDILSALNRNGIPNPAGFPNKPSDFLEKAYALQHGNVENRNQCYILVGMLLSRHCESEQIQPSTEQRLLNDAGKMTGAINLALSNLYKLGNDLNNNQVGLDAISLSLRLIPTYIETVLGAAEGSKIVELVPNQSLLPWILSELAELATNFLYVFSKLLGQQETQYRNRFFSIHEIYNKEAQNPADLALSEQDISLEPLLP